MKEFFEMDLRLFDAGTNVNTTVGYANAASGEVTPYTEIEGLSEEMKTYYSDYLIDNAEPKLIQGTRPEFSGITSVYFGLLFSTRVWRSKKAIM